MEVLFSDIQTCVISHLRSAQKSVRVAMAWFTNEEIFNCLLDQMERGVVAELIIINDGINNNPSGLSFGRFIAAGGKLYLATEEGKMHHKFAIVDEQVVLTGSYNWTYFAEHRNYENLTVLRDADIARMFTAEHKRICGALSTTIEYHQAETFTVMTQGGYRPLLAEDLLCRSRRQESMGNYVKAISMARNAFELEPKQKAIAKAVNGLERKVNPANESEFTVAVGNVQNAPSDLGFIDLLKKATKAYRKKNFDEALENLDKAIALNADHAELYFWAALCLWRKRRYADGILRCDRALTLNPHYAKALNLRGILKLESGKMPIDLTDWDAAINAEPDFIKALYNRGVAFHKLKRWEEKKRDLNRCEELLNQHLIRYPKDSEAIALRGDVRALLGRKAEAKTDYLSAETVFNATDTDARDENITDRIAEGKKR